MTSGSRRDEPRPARRGPRPQGGARSGGVDISNAHVQVEGSVVGRDQNIFTTQLASLPRSLRVAILAIAVAVVVSLILLVVTQASTLASIVRGPEPMSGDFNIAVAEFGQVDVHGQIEHSAEGEVLSKTIANSITKELASLPGVSAQVRHDGVPLVSELDPPRREAALRSLASKLNADLIIFGHLVGSGDARTIEPEFYVRGGPRGAEEILGSNHLGTPVGAPEDLSKSVPSQTLRSRIEALAQFALGLERLVLKDPAAAVEWFERAASTPGWRNQEGKEVVYLFLGTAYKARNEPGDLDRARAAYETSARLNPNYARAYLGLGNVDYDVFARSGGQSRDALDRALAEYQKAATATDKPRTALVDGKVHLTEGNVYLVKAETGETDDFGRAQQEFAWVLNEVARGGSDLEELVPAADFGLGVVYERGYNDPAQAASYYQQCITRAGKNDDELKRLAQTQLAIVAGSQGR